MGQRWNGRSMRYRLCPHPPSAPSPAGGGREGHDSTLRKGTELAEQGFAVAGGHGRGEQVALQAVAAEFAQDACLVLGFHALGDQ